MYYALVLALFVLLVVLLPHDSKEHNYSLEYGGFHGSTLIPDSARRLYGGPEWWMSRPWWRPNMGSTECDAQCERECKYRCHQGCNLH